MSFPLIGTDFDIKHVNNSNKARYYNFFPYDFHNLLFGLKWPLSPKGLTHRNAKVIYNELDANTFSFEILCLLFLRELLASPFWWMGQFYLIGLGL